MTDWKTLEDNAYTPYSDKPRVCIVESSSGKTYKGVRIENVSFPLTIPAVQAACCICLSEGEIPAKIYLKDGEFEQLNTWANEFDLDVEILEEPMDWKTETLIQTDLENTDFKSRLSALLEQVVAPNSDFPVSALLFTESGYFEGVNIEINEWNQGLCAERVALCKAIAEGYSEFKRMEIHTRDGEISSPCGACRQVIIEHLPYHNIKLHHADGSQSEHLSVDLLPFSFKSSTLKMNKTRKA